MTDAGTIEVDGLTKRFGPVMAVDDLSFTVRPGQVTGFLGPNGAGKPVTELRHSLPQLDVGRQPAMDKPSPRGTHPSSAAGICKDQLRSSPVACGSAAGGHASVRHFATRFSVSVNWPASRTLIARAGGW